MSLGERIIRARKRKGWTRRELARRTGLHEDSLLKVEYGLRTDVAAQTIKSLAAALECTTDYLLDMATYRKTYHQQREASVS